MEWAAGGGERVDAALDRGIALEGRGMVWFDASVDNQRACAAPVFLLDRRVDPLDVGGRVGAGEGDPDEVSQALRDEVAVVDDHDEREGADRVIMRD